MDGHVIDGRNLLPAMGYIDLVWQTVGMMKGSMYTIIPVVFEELNFIRAIHLSKNDAVRVRITIQKGIYELCNLK